jgi:hypothetical protein
VSWPVSVVCLADSKLRTGNCRGIRVDGGCGARGARAHGDHLLVGALIGQEHALARLEGHMPSRSPDATPSRPPGMPGTTGGIVPHSGQAAYWVIRGGSRLTLQFGNIRRSCRSGLTHRRKGHGALLPESWILWPLPCEASAAPTHSPPAPYSAPHCPSSSALTGRGDILLRKASRGGCADRLLTDSSRTFRRNASASPADTRSGAGTPQCIAVLGRFRVERRANGEASSVMASAAVEAWCGLGGGCVLGVDALWPSGLCRPGCRSSHPPRLALR